MSPFITPRAYKRGRGHATHVQDKIKKKNGAVKSRFHSIIIATIQACILYTTLAQLPCFLCYLLVMCNAWSLNFLPAGLNFAMSYHVRAVHVLFSVYKPLITLCLNAIEISNIPLVQIPHTADHHIIIITTHAPNAFSNRPLLPIVLDGLSRTNKQSNCEVFI